MPIRFDAPNSNSDPLSDSGVMRILGDYQPSTPKPADLTQPVPDSQTKKCPRCRELLIPSARVCVYCNLYLSASESSLQSAYRAVRRRLRLPPPSA